MTESQPFPEKYRPGTRPTTMKPGEVMRGITDSLKVHVEKPISTMQYGIREVLGGRATMTVDEERISFDFGEQGYDVQVASEDARYILVAALPCFLELFLEKNRKYAGVEKGYPLGAAGIFPDVNRKVGILFDRMWNLNESVGEPTEEVIMDLIGHLFLMLAKMRPEVGE